MERVAVFVDAGYLFAQGSIELSGAKLPRGEIKLDFGAVVPALRRFAERVAKLPLLRIYWYDGTNEGPTAAQTAIARLDRVKVRLGFVNSSGQQKGVDSLIVTDMINLAWNGAMADCVLLSGDEDLRIGVQQAQEYGVQVHLLGVKPLRGSQSAFLYQEADTTHEWDEADLSEFMRVRQHDDRDTKFHPDSRGRIHDRRAEADRLQPIATRVVEEIPDAELKSLAESITRAGVLPKELDVRLLALAKQVLERYLSGREKRRLRNEVRKALAARLDDLG